MRMQLLKPTQSTRERLRDAFRLHISIRHPGGCSFLTNLSARFIALVWVEMHRSCHWQDRPMFNATGSKRGAAERAEALAAHNATPRAANMPLIVCKLTAAGDGDNCSNGLS